MWRLQRNTQQHPPPQKTPAAHTRVTRQVPGHRHGFHLSGGVTWMLKRTASYLLLLTYLRMSHLWNTTLLGTSLVIGVFHPWLPIILEDIFFDKDTIVIQAVEANDMQSIIYYIIYLFCCFQFGLYQTKSKYATRNGLSRWNHAKICELQSPIYSCMTNTKTWHCGSMTLDHGMSHKIKLNGNETEWNGTERQWNETEQQY